MLTRLSCLLLQCKQLSKLVRWHLLLWSLPRRANFYVLLQRGGYGFQYGCWKALRLPLQEKLEETPIDLLDRSWLPLALLLGELGAYIQAFFSKWNRRWVWKIQPA